MLNNRYVKHVSFNSYPIRSKYAFWEVTKTKKASFPLKIKIKIIYIYIGYNTLLYHYMLYIVYKLLILFYLNRSSLNFVVRESILLIPEGIPQVSIYEHSLKNVLI